MAWAAVPVSVGSKITAAQWNELIAAANERNLVSLKGTALSNVSAGNKIFAADLNGIRTRVEAMIPYFFDTYGGTVYTKSSLLTLALGHADWTDPTVVTGDRIKAIHVNELRLVMNLMEWTRIFLSNPSTGGENKIAQGNSAVSWDDAWSIAKTNYAATSWGGWDSPVSFRTYAFDLGGGNYMKRINHIRVWDCPVDIPDVDVADAVMQFTVNLYNDGGSGAGSIDIYPQVSFGGTPITQALSATGTLYVNVDHPTKNTTFHYSMRSNPAEPDLDSYECADSNGAVRGYRAYPYILWMQYDFQYS